MVGDTLTSLQNQIPLRVAPMEEDGSAPSDCSPSASRSSEMMMMMMMMRSRAEEDEAELPEDHRMNPEAISTESHENKNVNRDPQSEDKSVKPCKRKLDLISNLQDPEDKNPESPPPSKRWVIGPLFQSFKSKMACFTEIVMSPVRLFKPNELDGQAAPAGDGDSPSAEAKDFRDETFLNRESLLRSPVVQRLRFDTHSSNPSNTDEDGAGITLSGSQTVAVLEGEGPSTQPGSDNNTDFQTSDRISPKNVSCSVLSPKKSLDILCEQSSESSPVYEDGDDPRHLDGPDYGKEVEKMDDPTLGKLLGRTREGEVQSTGSSERASRTRRRKMDRTNGPVSDGVGTSRTTRQLRKPGLDDERKPEDAHNDQSRRSEAAASNAKRRRNNVRQPKQTPAPVSKRFNTRAGRKVVDDSYEDQGMSMSLTLKVGSGESPETEPLMSCGIVRIEAKMDDGKTSCRSKAAPELYTSTDKDKKEDKMRRRCITSDRTRPNDTPVHASNRLKRSLSCPDISSLRHGPDAPSAPLSGFKKSPHVHSRSPSKRERRHTVCSVEIEREIAPLCLRKEVYPNHGSTHSPSKSLADLVSRFLSSPLAFLSKKSSAGRSDDSGYGTSSSDLGLRSSSPSPPSLASPSTSFTSSPAFLTDTPEQASITSHSSVFDLVPMEEVGLVQQENESTAASEEKALSDSEIKTDSKQVERRKVSSIRIRKTLPKPQYNLTPMGLPKAVRIKKKVFSVEEIYTNKNFSKPPEGRLETIYEAPLSRRDGSQFSVGPKRVKRFIEFPELGVARKPKRPPIGGAGGGGAQRKAAGNPGTGRTRRGVWASAREEEALLPQDFDSLLCSKLTELDQWMSVEQMAY